MKKFLLLVPLLITFSLQNTFGQRFLNEVFQLVDSIADIQYGQALNYIHEMQPLYVDFFEPRSDTMQKRPLFIFAHGGGFAEGSRKMPLHIPTICERLAKKGYATASISYRLDPRFNIFKSHTDRKAMTDAMHDMRAAIRFFKAHWEKYRIDTTQIFISGESAGAVTAMMVGYVDKQQELNAYPNTRPDNIEGDSGTSGHSSQVKAVLCLCGLIIDTTAIDSPKDDPLLWIHGSSDPMVPFSIAEEITERAEHIGLNYKKIVFEGATHCPWYQGLPRWQSYLDSMLIYASNFMYSFITGKEAPILVKAPASLKVASILQSNMVIQQSKPFRIWGSSSLGDTIEIHADWVKTPTRVYAGENGEWEGNLSVPKAIPGNFKPHAILVICKKDTVRLQNILIGEVWICAGQSNMDMKIQEVTGWYRGVPDYKKEVAAANYPSIRVFTEPASFKVKPQNESNGEWEVCSPKAAGSFSAVAYFFGRKLFQKLNVPIGLVVVAVAGANATAFVEKEIFINDPLLKKVYWNPSESYVASQAKVDSLDFFTKVTRPTLVYNGMMHPLEKLSIHGFIWYQGESNYEDKKYTYLCSAMLKSWRRNFNQGDLPFYFAQIAPYTQNMNKCPYILGLFWEAQEALLKVKNTGMAMSMDVGEADNVHPRNKEPVGVRLAKIALRRTYGFNSLLDKGPQFSKYRISRDGTVKISFIPGTVGSGLNTNDGRHPKCFSLAGEDQLFYPATAQIVNNEVWINSKNVTYPVAVRYGFTNDAITNFQNKEGLPAAPFRTDRWDSCSERK